METHSKPAENQALSNQQPGLPLGDMPIRVRQVDIAKLLGLTRQRVSQLVGDGVIPTIGGRIDPTAAVQALISREGPRAATKVLPEIRASLQQLEKERDAAMAASAQAHARIAELERELHIALGRAARVARDTINLEFAIDMVIDQSSDLEAAFETALERAMKLPLRELRGDPELLALARIHSPSTVPPSEPQNG